MRGGWQIDNGRDGACTSALSIIVLQQIHAVVCLRPCNSFERAHSNRRLFTEAKGVYCLAGLNSLCIWEWMTQIKGYSLFPWPIFTFWFFLKLSVQVEQRQKCVLVLLWKCKIIVFIYHLNQQRNLTPTWLRGQDFDRSSSKNQRELHLKGQYYSEYCIHYICQRWEQNTGSMTITPWVYLLVNWWVPHRCKAVIWEVSEKRNTRKEAHFTGLIRL